jgi:hypothetical protein
MYWFKTYNVLISTKKFFKSKKGISQHLEKICDETNEQYINKTLKVLDRQLERELINQEEYIQQKKQLMNYDCREDPNFSSSRFLFHIDDHLLAEYPNMFTETA